jgi:SAM-dependent methyltransferase
VKRLQNEIARYQEAFKGRMRQQVPPIWDQVEKRFADAVESATGVRDLYQYVARHVKGKARVSVLGLGSGACGNELDGIAPLLKAQSCDMDLTCVDVNATVLEQAAAEARKRGVQFHGFVQDANRIILEQGCYDVIVAYASLHHFVELDRICAEIGRALTTNGIFVTVDIPTRNGYRMWDETLGIVNAIWRALPPKFKVAHTGHSVPTYVESYENEDYSANSFECINSEAILPALRKHLNEVHYVPALSMARRFFDTKFGPNYDLDESLDRAIFEFVMELDTFYLKMGFLKPETFFGAYAKRSLLPSR